MQTKRYATFIAFVVIMIGILSGLVWKLLANPASAQATSIPTYSMQRGQWISLNQYSGNPPFPVWVNLERADSIRFYTGSYDTRQNVPQATVMLGRDFIQVNDPHEMGVLRRYVQSHQLR